MNNGIFSRLLLPSWSATKIIDYFYHMPAFKPFLFTILSLSLNACVSTQRTDLFFGMDIPGGGQVSNDQWEKFTDSIVSPRFPAGYTEWDAAGKWLDTETKQTISEHTKVLTFIGKKSGQRENLLDTITQSYIYQFKQQAVLRLNSKSKARFITRNPG